MCKDDDQRPILPVSLLLAGQPALVVGGGPVAARKAGHLVHADAVVTVVAPALCDAFRELTEVGRLRLLKRPFEDGDLDGMRVVFAATDDPAVNRHVVDLCRKQGLLVSAADANWSLGDFMMPAVCRKAGLVVTVSTGGRSCKRAKAVRDRIAAWLDTLGPDADGDARA